jgi:hypothetical protein
MLDLRTQAEAAEALRLSERTLERMRLTDLGLVKAGRRVLYRTAYQEEWVAAQVPASTSEVRR